MNKIGMILSLTLLIALTTACAFAAQPKKSPKSQRPAPPQTSVDIAVSLSLLPLNEVKALLSKTSLDLDAPLTPKGNSTPLFCSLSNEDPSVFAYLLEKGAKIESPSGVQYILAAAIEAESVGFITALVKHGADINTINVNNWSVLMLAMEHAPIPVINEVLSHNPDLAYSCTVVEDAYSVYRRREQRLTDEIFGETALKYGDNKKEFNAQVRKALKDVEALELRFDNAYKKAKWEE